MKKVLLWGVVILVVVIGGYYVWDEIGYARAESISTLAIEDTSTWKTYTNTELGYTIKYPSEYVFSEVMDNSDELKKMYPQAVGIQDPEDEPYKSRFDITVIRQKELDSSTYYSPKSFAKRVMARGLFNSVSFSSLQKVNVGGGKAILVLRDGMANRDIDSKRIVALRGEFAYIVSWEPVDHAHFQTIASTFRLIK